jgi:hypothetical protein
MKIYVLLLCLLFIITSCTVQPVELAETTTGTTPESIYTEAEPTTNNNETQPEFTAPAPNSTYEEANEEADSGRDSGIMEVHVFGIGRADAVLITTENHAVLIDTGERNHGWQIANYLFSLDIRRIDYLIITHFDSDPIIAAGTQAIATFNHNTNVSLRSGCVLLSANGLSFLK